VSDPRRAVPPEWEPRLAQDLAELVEAARALAVDGRMQELPDDFARLLTRLAETRKTR
jgi:hypothetical protein